MKIRYAVVRDSIVRCVNCGDKRKAAFRIPVGWADVEFYDGWFNVCTKCKRYFTREELRKELQAVIPCNRRNFKRRLTPVKGRSEDKKGKGV